MKFTRIIQTPLGDIEVELNEVQHWSLVEEKRADLRLQKFAPVINKYLQNL